MYVVCGEGMVNALSPRQDSVSTGKLPSATPTRQVLRMHTSIATKWILSWTMPGTWLARWRSRIGDGPDVRSRVNEVP